MEDKLPLAGEGGGRLHPQVPTVTAIEIVVLCTSWNKKWAETLPVS